MPHTATHQVMTAPASPHTVGTRPDVLYKITESSVNLSLWQRPPQAAIVRELSTLQASHLQDVRRPTSLESFDADVCMLLQQQGLEPTAFYNLRADMRRLADLFSSISEGREFIFRLLTTDRDDCRRFHLDRMRFRLLCTYRGPGTEWLSDAQVDRAALKRGAPNDAIVRFGEPSRFEPFWVGILRGDPKKQGVGLVHRSPPLAGSGQIRVLFCLDG